MAGMAVWALSRSSRDLDTAMQGASGAAIARSGVLGMGPLQNGSDPEMKEALMLQLRHAKSSEKRLRELLKRTNATKGKLNRQLRKTVKQLKGTESALVKSEARVKEFITMESRRQRAEIVERAKFASSTEEPVFDQVYGWSSGNIGEQASTCSVPQKMEGILKMIVCFPFPQQFDRCALVGSSSDLDGKNQGREIDSHDTVIRVNRVPNELFREDFGNRTDILFAGPVAEKRPMYTWLGMFYRKMGGEYEMCQFRSHTCPFKALILKGADFREFGRPWERRYPVENPGWKPRKSNWPLSHQDDAVNNFAYDLVGGKRPTNGFQAFLTFTLLCNSLDVYGFTGSGTADGHWMSKHHNLTFEHDVQRQLMDGSFANFVGDKKLEPVIFARLQAMAGKVRIVHPGDPPVASPVR